MSPRISRKDFLKWLGLSAAGGLVTACGLDGSQTGPSVPSASPSSLPTAVPTPLPSPTLPPVLPSLKLTSRDSQVWTWHARAVGLATPPEACQATTVMVNGHAYPVEWVGDRFTAEVLLDEGENAILATCQLPGGQMLLSNPATYTIPLRRGPKAIPQVTLSDGRIVLDSRASQADEQDRATLTDVVWSPRPGNPAAARLAGLQVGEGRPFDGPLSAERLELVLPEVDGEYYFTLEVRDRLDRCDRGSLYIEVAAGKARIPDYDRENPAWVETAIVYGVIPFMFGAHGFSAVTARLDDLADLGVNALWFSPINVSPAYDYGYAVVDYFNLNPAYGTKAEFHRLVQEAHARGIRVLMDFVPNHSSEQHPYYKEALELGQESHYWEFYDRDKAGNATHYFNWDYLPNLNYHNPEVRRWITEAFSYWVREFDVDGFRVDAAWGVKERRPDFWPEWRRELKRIKPDLLLLAEASARDPYYFDNGFDVGYDWTDQLGKWAWEMVWETYKNRQLVYNLDSALANRPAGYHPDALVFRFLNNNDTGDRFITRHGEAMARLATALLLTLPGVPCIYTGDEVGAEFKPYSDPPPLTWEEKFPGLRSYHQQLIALRKQLPALHSRQWRRVETAPSPQAVFGYLRTEASGNAPALVLLNFSEEPSDVELQLPEEVKAPAGSLTDRLSGEKIPAARALKVSMPAVSARILTLA